MPGLFAYADDETKKNILELAVLIVDDQQEIRMLVRDILMEAGVTRVFEAANGREALGLLAAGFDVINFVISDWNMPGLPGIDFLRRVRAAYPDMPFLMITGRNDKNSVIDAKGAGVSAYIRKPFSPRQLEEKMKALLSKKPGA